MPFEYTTAEELIAICTKQQISIGEVCLRREMALQETTRESLLEKMRGHYRVMKDSIQKGLNLTETSPSGLSGGDAAKLFDYANSTQPLFGAEFAKVIAYGFAVLEHNAQFGRIVATPTAGSAGIVPACLFSLEEMKRIDEDKAVMALFTSAGIGVIIGAQANFSGAQGGCQAEVGSAACMAAAAVVESLGGSPQQALDAAAFALMNTLGLVCDPIGGYVEVPCVSRNGMFAVHAFQAAVMSLAGARCVVPFDHVVLAMRDIGRRMPRALKETSQAGLATTPTGLRFPPPGY
ncbi:MAG: L-serine ammonia-lyase, iron-sulfur-dependent, subunit alpha [Chthoniobacterales bacterium]